MYIMNQERIKGERGGKARGGKERGEREKRRGEEGRGKKKMKLKLPARVSKNIITHFCHVLF